MGKQLGDAMNKHAVTIDCPKCGAHNQATIGDLRSNREFTCTGCGEKVTVQTEKLEDGVRQADKALDDLKSRIKKM